MTPLGKKSPGGPVSACNRTTASASFSARDGLQADSGQKAVRPRGRGSVESCQAQPVQEGQGRSADPCGCEGATHPQPERIQIQIPRQTPSAPEGGSRLLAQS